LNVYTHLFDHAEHAVTVMERLEGRFGDVLQPAEAQTQAVCETAAVQQLGNFAGATAAWPTSGGPDTTTQLTTTTSFFKEMR
jgi:hypothetical protein